MQERSASLYNLLMAYDIVREEEQSEFQPGEAGSGEGRDGGNTGKRRGKDGDERPSKGKSEPDKIAPMTNGKGG